MTKPIHIDIDDREVRRALENLQRRIKDLTPVMHDIGQLLVEGMRARLRDSRDVEGRPFAPNSPVTLARKKGTRPLVDSGMMASQFAQNRAPPFYGVSDRLWRWRTSIEWQIRIREVGVAMESAYSLGAEKQRAIELAHDHKDA